MLGLLWALTQFALRGLCSAFEAHIAISLVAAMTFAGLPVFFASERTDSFGDVILGTCNFWAALLGAMFWTKGKRGSASQLMLGLARSNSYVWFFGKVELADNWLPRAMEAFFILLLLPVFVIVLKVWVDGIRKLWRGQSHDGPRRDNQQEPVAGGPFQGLREYYVRSVQPASIFLYTFVGLGALILVFTIVSVEMTIQYNQPELESEFWSLSQTLPLAIGVVVGGDGLILLWKTYRKVGGKKVDGRFGGAAESLLRERGGTGGSLACYSDSGGASDLGTFPLNKVKDYVDQLPRSVVARGGAFFPMHRRESSNVDKFSIRWIIYNQGLCWGGFNAVSGEHKSGAVGAAQYSGTNVQDYVVTPE
ncbi:hypothetical protein GQ53DRAFT_814053 [Thozetella sp. PMI_491]|nr:hypothetical protein GQ53DRAFT_814053 [Thozetella sp. PMI_491]